MNVPQTMIMMDPPFQHICWLYQLALFIDPSLKVARIDSHNASDDSSFLEMKENLDIDGVTSKRKEKDSFFKKQLTKDRTRRRIQYFIVSIHQTFSEKKPGG